jgi:hypothetical protein
MRSSSSALMVPAVPASLISSAIDLPTPGMRRSSAGNTRETSSECPATARAAFLVGPGPESVAAGDQEQVGVLL